MDRFEVQARACCKSGDYRKAIELFGRAIGRRANVQLLDARASCYEKLHDLQAALKDAKRAIQLQREDATGYLRAGKVLVKMGRESTALEILTHGLKSIQHVGQGYEVGHALKSTPYPFVQMLIMVIVIADSSSRTPQPDFASKEYRSSDCSST